MLRAVVLSSALMLPPTASDSDDPYLQPTNRGNKLKRKAHHIQDEQSGRVTGTKAYKRVGFNTSQCLLGHRSDILS